MEGTWLESPPCPVAELLASRAPCPAHPLSNGRAHLHVQKADAVAHIVLEFGLGRILWKRERRGVHAVREGEEEARDDGVLIGRHPDDIGLPANAAAWTLVHACHGAGGSEGTRLLLAGQVRAQEGRQATRARGALRRGQCWIRWNVGRAAGVQAQSAQGMGAQKRGAAPPLGSGKARGVGVRRRGAAQHSTMVRVGIRAPVPW